MLQRRQGMELSTLVVAGVWWVWLYAYFASPRIQENKKVLLRVGSVSISVALWISHLIGLFFSPVFLPHMLVLCLRLGYISICGTCLIMFVWFGPIRVREWSFYTGAERRMEPDHSHPGSKGWLQQSWLNHPLRCIPILWRQGSLQLAGVKGFVRFAFGLDPRFVAQNCSQCS